MCRGPAAGPEALVRLACPLRPSRAVLHLRPGDPRMAINDECKADICNASLDTCAVRTDLEARVLMFRRRNFLVSSRTACSPSGACILQFRAPRRGSSRAVFVAQTEERIL